MLPYRYTHKGSIRTAPTDSHLQKRVPVFIATLNIHKFEDSVPTQQQMSQSHTHTFCMNASHPELHKPASIHVFKYNKAPLIS